MTEFHDGPAAGVTLWLRRAPVFIRAVRTPRGQWDALDQLADRPEANEELFAYRREGEVGYIHINTRGKPGGGVFRPADYRHLPDQPDDATMRDTARWRAWCTEQLAKEKAGG